MGYAPMLALIPSPHGVRRGDMSAVKQASIQTETSSPLADLACTSIARISCQYPDENRAMVMTATPRSAFVAMIVGAAFISTTSVFVKWANVAPTVSAFYRMLFGGVMLLVGLQVLRRWQLLRWRSAALLIVPALAFAADLWMWHRSIRDIGPGLATLLGNFQVFMMALAGVVFYREQLGWRFLAGLALAFTGLWLLIGRSWGSFDAQYQRGVWLGIATGVAYAVFMLTFRQTQRGALARTSPAQVLCINSLLCAAVLGLVVLGEHASFAIPSAQSWASLLALGFFGQVLGWVLIVYAMPLLPASLVGLLLLLQPLLSFVFDVILFARPTVALDWTGLAISLAGIFVASARPKPAEPV